MDCDLLWNILFMGLVTMQSKISKIGIFNKCFNFYCIFDKIFWCSKSLKVFTWHSHFVNIQHHVVNNVFKIILSHYVQMFSRVLKAFIGRKKWPFRYKPTKNQKSLHTPKMTTIEMSWTSVCSFMPSIFSLLRKTILQFPFGGQYLSSL